MKYILQKWQLLGITIGFMVIIYLILVHPKLTMLQFLLTINLLALFAHQFEEYQFPGGAPAIINRVVYDEKVLIDRYPGNSLSLALVNMIAWVIYGISLFYDKVIWLGLGVILFSLFQIIGYAFQMNITLKRWYNPGLLTTLFFFLPIGITYIMEIKNQGLVTLGTIFGACMVLVICILTSIVLPVQLLKDKKTKYVIDAVQMDKYHKVLKKVSFGTKVYKNWYHFEVYIAGIYIIMLGMGNWSNQGKILILGLIFIHLHFFEEFGFPGGFAFGGIKVERKVVDRDVSKWPLNHLSAFLVINGLQ